MLKRSPLNQFSAKKVKQMWDEQPIRKALCERVGGVFVSRTMQIKKKTREVVDVPISYCKGGICEICGKPAGAYGLHPHEKNFRSRGGLLSLENSVMCHNYCQAVEHGVKVVHSKPIWSSKDK